MISKTAAKVSQSPVKLALRTMHQSNFAVYTMVQIVLSGSYQERFQSVSETLLQCSENVAEKNTFLAISRQPLVGITRGFLRLKRYTQY